MREGFGSGHVLIMCQVWGCPIWPDVEEPVIRPPAKVKIRARLPRNICPLTDVDNETRQPVEIPGFPSVRRSKGAGGKRGETAVMKVICCV